MWMGDEIPGNGISSPIHAGSIDVVTGKAMIEQQTGKENKYGPDINYEKHLPALRYGRG